MKEVKMATCFKENFMEMLLNILLHLDQYLVKSFFYSLLGLFIIYRQIIFVSQARYIKLDQKFQCSVSVVTQIPGGM